MMLNSSVTKNSSNQENVIYSKNSTSAAFTSASTNVTTTITTTSTASTTTVVNSNETQLKNSMDIVNDIDHFLESEEGNKLLKKVTSIDIFNQKDPSNNSISNKTSVLSEPHILKQTGCKLQNNLSNNNNNNNIVKLFEKPRTSNVENILERSVSSQMGKKELSGFSKFAREMRSESKITFKFIIIFCNSVNEE